MASACPKPLPPGLSEVTTVRCGTLTVAENHAVPDGNVTGGHVGEHFHGVQRDCGPCPLRAQCLRTPGTTPVRNVAFFRDRVGRDVNDSALMRDRIDAPAGRAQYARRFATVEPVFANLRANTRLDRFTLRGRAKVDTPRKLYSLVYNIEKLATNGYAA